MPNPILKLENICKDYQEEEHTLRVLKNINIEIFPGELVAIMGASGSGKSTTMNIIGLLDTPSEGKYFLHGQEVSHLNDDELSRMRNLAIGFVFQQFYLLSAFSAQKNVEIPLTYAGFSTADRKKMATAALEKIGILNLAKRRPNQMSGGQQQRVAIARALSCNPDIILADEPTGALDSKTGNEIMELLISLNRNEKKTIIIVTHDLLIGKRCDRIIYIKDGMVVKQTEEYKI